MTVDLREALREAAAAKRAADANLREAVTQALAAGLNVRQTAIASGLTRTTIYKWKQDRT